MDCNEDSLKSGPYLETVRTLHQTVVSLRGALEQSRTEILELKNKSWPLENLETAITALSLENHLLRQKIINLDRSDDFKPAQTSEHEVKQVESCTEENITSNLENRFKSITSSLENISTTKSHKKSSHSPRLQLKTKSFQNINTASDYDQIFTSTPLRSREPPKLVTKKKAVTIDDNKTDYSENIVSSEEPQDASSIINLDVNDNPQLSHNDYTDCTKDDSLEDELNPNRDIEQASKLDDQTLEANKTKLKPTNSTNSFKDRSRDKKDKKISVSINLDIFQKSSRRQLKFKMEGNNVLKNGTNTSNIVEEEEVNEGVLQHSSSTELLDQEVDDIELIFTSEDTKEANLKEPLISIDGAGDGQNLQCQLGDFDPNASADTSDRELEDDVFNDNFENENQENSNFQSQTFDFTRENSQIYNSKSDNSINQDEVKSLKSYYSYQDSSFENKSLEKDESFDRFEERIRIVETDISKVGIQDVEYSLGRRNTCPNPIQYRPMAHREAIGRGLSTRKTRPILAHSTAIRKESGAQTDISALPSKNSWRSESSLAHKVKIGDNFTTLPSKYPLPGSRLRLSEKTVEARRVLLSDIGFTSMVPELSRSADHLFPPNLKTPSVSNYGQFLKTTDLYSPGFASQRFMWTNASPSDSHSHSRYSSLYPLPSPPAPSRRCSAPVSPCRKSVLKHVPSKVRFANGSLPELRGDWNTTIDSGDSTDSLVEEAEQYLRRSIDCIVGGRDITCYSTTKSSLRRASAPEPARDNIPPQGWQPFLPRLPRDLRLDYWVKVISPEGRVRGGRVRFVGHLLSQSEQFVGVQLSTPEGHSDGTHHNRRYFQCEPYHGIFVPFKKVIMGWKP